MKTKSICLKIIPVCLALPLILTGCESMKSFFGDSSPPAGYGSSYPAVDKHTHNQYQPAVDTENKTVTKASSREKAAASQSGAEGSTVLVPVSTDKKTEAGTVTTPAVPSSAPTVGQ